MRVQHNIPAMNAYRNYNNNTKAIAKNLEKLSSGYRINRAGDDAAGLAISEKMRAQITGLATAQKNAKDGISLIQTAEGALTEVHSMLNRMFELAEQSANGTYDNEVDRANLQKEFDALRSEIDRIADSSNFNGKNLLDGSLDSAMRVTNADWAIEADIATKGSTATLGTETILHQNAPQAVKTSFSVELHNISLDLKENDVFKLDLGNGSSIELTAKSSPGAIAAPTTAAATGEIGEGKYSGSQLAAFIQTNFGTLKFAADDTSLQDFTVKASGSTLTFTQNSIPASAGKVVEASAGVSMTLNNAGGGSMNIGGSANHTASHNTNRTNETKGTQAGAEILASTQVTLTDTMLADGNTITIGDQTYTFKRDANSTASGSTVIDLTDMAGAPTADLVKKAAERITAAAAGNSVFTVGFSGTITGGNSAELTLVERQGQRVMDLTTFNGIQKNVQAGTAVAGAGTSLSLQIGDTSADYNMLKVSVGDMHVRALGIDARNINIDRQDLAQNAMDSIKNAVNSVSSTRGDLGALQNRLDHTINNLGVMEENIQDAESTIRDTDVAAEMMKYTKNNILIQSAQAMLAQANQLPQGVLQLLG